MLLSKAASAIGSGVEDGIDEVALIASAQADIVQKAEIAGFLMYAGVPFYLLRQAAGILVRGQILSPYLSAVWPPPVVALFAKRHQYGIPATVVLR
jgi:hypothetical protein